MLVFCRKNFVGFNQKKGDKDFLLTKKRRGEDIFFRFSPNGFEKFVLIFPPIMEIPKVLRELCGNSFDLSIL